VHKLKTFGRGIDKKQANTRQIPSRSVEARYEANLNGICPSRVPPVVANDTGRSGSQPALAGRLLPRLPDKPRDRYPHH